MIMLKDLFEKMATSWSDPLTFKLVQIPELTVFHWLCQETQWSKYKFDCKLIEATFAKIDELKGQADALLDQTLLINRRQGLLGIAVTDF